MSHHEHKIIQRTISFNSPKDVLLQNPTVLPVFAVFAAAVIFTIWPSALEHSPISFERRGVIHHIWHYTLLSGCLVTLYGMFSAHRLRAQIEFFGQVTLVVALALNFIAQTSTLVDEGASRAVLEGVTGVGLALRAGIILHLALRAWVLFKRPTQIVKIQTTTTNGNGE